MAKKKTKKAKKVIAAELDIRDLGGVSKLMIGDEVLLTPEGDEVAHPSREFVEHLLAEFDLQGSLTIRDRIVVSPRFFGAYAILGIQKAYIERGKEELTTQFGLELSRDPILYRCAGPEVVDQLARWEPVMEFLGDLDLKLPSLPQSYEFLGIPVPEDEKAEVPTYGLTDDFIEPLRKEYLKLPLERRAITMFLHAIHGNPVLFPLVLALSRCNPDQYASGILASHCVIADVFGDVKQKHHKKAYIGLRDDARTALEYVRLYNSGAAAEIAGGESITREFKSTLRWNIKAGKNDDAITHAVLKTIAAFMNSDGGTLFIGVSDRGEILGLDADGFENEDRYAVHFTNVLRQSIGEASSAEVRITFPCVDGKCVCRVECGKSKSPVFLKYKGEEEFFIRNGPSSTKLPPSHLVRYVKEHFPEVSA